MDTDTDMVMDTDTEVLMVTAVLTDTGREHTDMVRTKRKIKNKSVGFLKRGWIKVMKNGR